MTKEKTDFDIAVIGGGAAGTMAYLRSILNFDRTAFFIGNADTKRAARATWVSEVDNMPGMHDLKTPLVKNQMSTLKWVKEHPEIQKYGTLFRHAISKIERSPHDNFILHYESKEGPQSISASYVIVATGVMDVQPIISGSIEPIFPYANRNDVLYCIRCDGHRVHGHVLSVIGRGDTAVYIATILKERYQNDQVFILTHGEKSVFSEETQRLIALYAFDVREEEIVDVKGDPKKEGLAGFVLADGYFVPSTRSVVALGSIAYNDLLKALDVKTDETGRVPVSKECETNIEKVFVVGDLVAGKKMQIYTAWDEAVDAADAINRRIRLDKRAQLIKTKGMA